jgi:putative ABC transport system ATP-binding protein
METILTARSLTKVYQMGEVTIEALRGTDFDIYEGEFVVVLGASGSGKSTMLNIIGGMDGPTSGELFYKGTPLHTMSQRALTLYRRSAVGFVFQFYNLMPNLTARENVELSAQIAKNPLGVDEILEDVGLSDRADHFPSQLSGGQQQRVAIARAIVKNPDMLLCDEPTGALDFSTGLSVLNVLRDFNQKYKKTVVIITHNAAIGEIADRVFTIKDGMLIHIKENERPLRPEEVSW